MMSQNLEEQTVWTEDEIRELLTPRPLTVEANPLTTNPFIRAAAALVHFSPNTLRPVTPVAGPERDAAFQTLIEKSALVTSASGLEQQWTLSDDARQRVLRTMDRTLLLRALSINPAPTDLRQQFISRLLDGESIDFSGLQLEELRALCQVAGWLRGVQGVTVPDDHVLRARIARAELLQPFRHLVGHHFRGRRTELDTLRSYVGVVTPDVARSRIQQAATALRNIFDLDREPPLFIQGAGGSGKSTLLGKFVLEHAEAAEEFQFPFVYLDFDRPGLMGEDPTLLLIEIAAQLDVQFPDRGLHELHRKWNDEVITDSESGHHVDQERIFETQTSSSFGRRVQWLTEFTNALAFDSSSGKPFVLVLDTFEEVQYRSSGYVAGLWDFLKQLQQSLPRMRVVLAGRAPMARHPTRILELNDFDREAALGFLAHLDVPEETAEVLFQHLGGNPLTLKLGAEVVRREEGSTEGLLSIKTRGLLHGRLDAARVQGMLYDRILEHVKNDKVKWLAHPGLVLRRITPELISEVLAEPCGVDITEDVDQLFQEFAREVSLVLQEPDGSIRHIPYIRKAMLPSVRSQSETVAEAIDDKAIEYYEKQDGPVARAEELYHRLMRSDSKDVIDPRWDDEAAETLASALDELPPAGQAYLGSRLGIEVSAEVRKAADIELWEIDAERRARHLIKVGKLKEALAVLEERKQWSPGSRLYVLTASIQAQQGKPIDARNNVERGLASADASTSAGTILDLTLLRARLDELMGDFEAAAASYSEVIEQSRKRRDARLIWEAGLARLGLHHMGVATPVDVPALRELMIRTYQRTPIAEHARFAGLLRWVAGEIAAHNPELMKVIINDVSLGTLSPVQQQVYARVRQRHPAARKGPGVPRNIRYFADYVLDQLANPENGAAAAAAGAMLRAGGLAHAAVDSLPPAWPSTDGDQIRYFPDVAELGRLGRRLRGETFSELQAAIDHGEVLVGVYTDPEIDDLGIVLESEHRMRELKASNWKRSAVFAVWTAAVNQVLQEEERLWRTRLYPQLGAEALGAPPRVRAAAKKPAARKQSNVIKRAR